MKNARCGSRRPSPRRTHGGAWSPWSPRHRSASSTMMRESRRAPHRARARRPLAQRPRRDQGREGRRRGMEDPRRPRAGARARARRGEGGDRRLDAPPPPDGTDGPTRRAAPRTTPRRPRVASRRPRHARPRGARAAPEAWRLSAAGSPRTSRRSGTSRGSANSARRNLGAIVEPLRTHAVHAYAGRLQRLERGRDGSTLAWEACVERAGDVAARGPEGDGFAAAADATGGVNRVGLRPRVRSSAAHGDAGRPRSWTSTRASRPTPTGRSSMASIAGNHRRERRHRPLHSAARGDAGPDL